MREPKGTVGAVKAMKHDSSPTRAMRDPKGTAGAGEEMKQRREMLKVGYQQSPHFAMDDDSRSIDHWRKFFDNTDPSQDHVNPSMLDEEVDRKQTIPQGIVNKLGKPFTTHSRPGKNLSLLSIPKQENQTCEIQTKPSVVEDNKTKQPKKEINQASLERAKRKLKEGYQQAEIVTVEGMTDMDLHMTALALELCCTWMTNKQSSESVGLIVRQKALPQALMLIRSSLLQGQGLQEKTSLTKLTVHRHGGVNVVGFVKWLQQDGVFASFPTSSQKSPRISELPTKAMREPKGTVGAVKAMKHDSSPTRAMRDQRERLELAKR
ncbi:hypothetical protein HPP92_012174 [Vanilla planifolia]|uniref:Uncharacterized protein n=1 Tax=Vanilla planifolia TaxID=51239 RepID=A0A835V338_VANPL|nr:hypothetical protein HPP92_012174 [Vanilla planifolia]